MAGSPEENRGPDADRSSNTSSSSSSSSSTSSGSSDNDELAETRAEAAGELEGGARPEEAGVDATSGIVNAQEQRHQHKESDAEETGRLNLGSDTMFILMVAGVVAVASLQLSSTRSAETSLAAGAGAAP